MKTSRKKLALMSQRAYARARSMSSTWISKLCREGRIPTIAGRIDPVAADAVLAAEATATSNKITRAQVEIRWRLATARLRELELDRLRGGLVSVADVEEMQIRVNLNVRARLLAIPAKLTPQLVGITQPAKVKAILEKEVRLACEELVQLAVP